MYLEALTEFSAAQDISQTAGTYESTNVYDTDNSDGNAADFAKGDPFCVLFTIVQAVAGAGATIEMRVVASTVATLDNGDEVTLGSTGPLSVNNGDLAAAKQYTVKCAGVENLPATHRYIGVNYVIAGATTTAGTVNAIVAADVQNNFSDNIAEDGF